MINPDEPIDNGAQTDVVIEPTQVDQPQPVSQPMDGNGKADTISDAVRRARESIPVGDHGVTPTVYEHQITIAKDKAKAHLLLPIHMRNNAPVMAALVGFVARFDLEPVMFASQTYVVPGSDRLSFTSQAFGAILYASKLLIGRLKYEYRGEGDDLTCRVIGRFREDPDTIYDSTTPPLRQVKKHSPLWRDDPEQQLGYYAQRRWMRKYTPDVCMGMYTREEQLELDEFRRSRGESVPLSADRLGQLDTGEGWGDGAHVDMDLAAIAPEQPPEAEPEVEAAPSPRAKTEKWREHRAAVKAARAKPVQARKPVGRPKPVSSPKAAPAKPVARPRGRPPTSAVVKAAVKRAEQPPPRRVAPMPRWLDYVTETEEWIKKLSADEAPQAEGRWEGERAERDKTQVPIGERSRLRALLDRKLAQIGKDS